MFLCIREATIAVVRREDFRLVHLSIQANHLHLIVEAAGNSSLGRGMQSFLGSAAKHIKASLRAAGVVSVPAAVFPDRYHRTTLTTPRAVRNAIAYVLNNWRRHHEDHDATTRRWKLDPYSSAIDFAGWSGLAGSPTLYRAPAGHRSLVVRQPRTWLLRVGWHKHHAAIAERELPGPRPHVARSAAGASAMVAASGRGTDVEAASRNGCGVWHAVGLRRGRSNPISNAITLSDARPRRLMDPRGDTRTIGPTRMSAQSNRAASDRRPQRTIV